MQLTDVLRAALLLAWSMAQAKLTSIADVREQVEQLSPNMCADIKDRYDVDIWRRPSGAIRFPIGAWSSPIGVYSRGTPKILADYVAANFSMLEISGGALGPVDALTQWKYVTEWTQRAAAADLRVMLDTYSYAPWAPWNKSSSSSSAIEANERSRGRVTISPTELRWLLNTTNDPSGLLHEGTISMMLFNDDVSHITSTEKELSGILQSQPAGKRTVMPWVNSIGRECSVLSHYGFPYYIGELYDVKNGHGTPAAMGAAQLGRFTLARDSSTRWRVEPMPLFNTGNGGHYIVRPASLDTFQAYGQVALGTRGLMYYTWGSIYSDGSGSNGTGAGPNFLYPDVARANSKIQSWAPYLYTADHCEGAYHTGWDVGGVLSLGRPTVGALASNANDGSKQYGGVVEEMSDLLMASLHTAPPGAAPEPPMEGDWDRSVLLMVVDKRVNVSITAVNGTVPNTSRVVSLTLSPLVSYVTAVGAVNAPISVQNITSDGSGTRLRVGLRLTAGDAAMLLLSSAESPPKMAASNPLVNLARRQLKWSFDKTQANLAPIEVGMGAASCCTPISGVLDVVHNDQELGMARRTGTGVMHVAWSPQNDTNFANLINGGHALAVVPGVDRSEHAMHSGTNPVTDPRDIITASLRYWCKPSVGAAVALNLSLPLSSAEKAHLAVLATEAKHGLPRGINTGSTTSLNGVKELALAGVVVPVLILPSLTIDGIDTSVGGASTTDMAASAEQLTVSLAALQALNASELGFTRSVGIDFCQISTLGLGPRLQSYLAMAYGARSLWFHNVLACNATLRQNSGMNSSIAASTMQAISTVASTIAGEFSGFGATLLQNEVIELVSTASWKVANSTSPNSTKLTTVGFVRSSGDNVNGSSGIIHSMDSDLVVSLLGRTAETAAVNASGMLVIDARLVPDNPDGLSSRFDHGHQEEMAPRCHPCNTRHCRVPCAPPKPKENVRSVELCLNVLVNASWKLHCKNVTLTPGEGTYLSMSAFLPPPPPPAPPGPPPPPPPPPPTPPSPTPIASKGWVWPKPRSSEVSGDVPLSLSSSFRFDIATGPVSAPAVGRLQRSAARYLRYLNLDHSSGSTTSLDVCTVTLASLNDDLSIDTNYSYSLHISDASSNGKGVATCGITAASVYGAMYAFETFTQLVYSPAGSNTTAPFNGSSPYLPHATVTIADSPMYRHRSLMIDAGRRFWPVPLVKDVLDSMSFVKLNVLLLHAVDFCRFGIESKLYPGLLGACDGSNPRCLKNGSFAGYYTQDDIKDLVAYGQDRGIRIIPEMEQPEHAYGYDELVGEGKIKVCTGAMLYNDPQNVTVNTLKNIFTEMASLFPDKVFSIGGDEPYIIGNCTLDTVVRMEQELARHIISLGKIPMGWEEILFRTQGAQVTNHSAIVASWSAHTAAEVIAAGYPAIEANAGRFYLAEREHGHNVCANEDQFWYDISHGVPHGSGNSLLLGGRMSFWTDEFSSCHSGESRAASLFPRTQDDGFARAVTGLLWPRAYMGAGSFWNYEPSLNVSGNPQFTADLYGLNTRFREQRNVSNCHCDPHKCVAQGCTFMSGCDGPY